MREGRLPPLLKALKDFQEYIPENFANGTVQMGKAEMTIAPYLVCALHSFSLLPN